MPDFNQVLEPGDYKDGTVNTVVEIPQGSFLKIEWDRERAAFMLDRVEPSIYAKPVNYGFIPQTLDEDGDELDTLVVCDEPIPTGVWLEANIVGVMNFEDDGDMDHKIVVVPADDRNTGDSIKTRGRPGRALEAESRRTFQSLQRPQEARNYQGAGLGRCGSRQENHR